MSREERQAQGAPPPHERNGAPTDHAQRAPAAPHSREGNGPSTRTAAVASGERIDGGVDHRLANGSLRLGLVSRGLSCKRQCCPLVHRQGGPLPVGAQRTPRVRPGRRVDCARAYGRAAASPAAGRSRTVGCASSFTTETGFGRRRPATKEAISVCAATKLCRRGVEPHEGRG